MLIGNTVLKKDNFIKCKENRMYYATYPPTINFLVVLLDIVCCFVGERGKSVFRILTLVKRQVRNTLLANTTEYNKYRREVSVQLW